MTSGKPKFSLGRAAALALALSLMIIVFAGNNYAAGRNGAARGNDRSVAFADHSPTVLTSTTYLPVLSNGFPLRTAFGFETFQLVNGGGWKEMTAAQASWVRRDGLLWSDVEPSPGARDWSNPSIQSLEQEMLNATSSGMQMILVVRQAPAWARVNSTNTCSAIAPSQYGAFGSFMRDLVARYSVQPYGIHNWEIWNEPDVDPNLLGGSNVTGAIGCWGNDSDPYYGGGAFGSMLQAIYPQMKAADPSAEVIVGGLLLDCAPGYVCNSGPRANKFLEGILKAGGAPYFDAIAFHAYEWHGNEALGHYSSPNWPSSWNTTGPLLIAKAQFIMQLLSQYGVTGKRLFSTETAVLCGAGCPDDNTFEMTKAYYVTQSFAAAMAQGLQSSIWYNYFGWYASGLASSSSPWGPLPAYTSYDVARRQLGDAQFANTVTTYPGVQGYAFTRRGHPLWVLWSQDGAAHPISLPSAATAALDAMGNPVTVSGNSVTVTITPIFVQLP